MWRAESLEKSLMLGKISRRGREQQKMRWLGGIIDSLDVSLSKVRDIVKDREAWRAAVHGVTKNWTWLSDWTTRTHQPKPVFPILWLDKLKEEVRGRRRLWPSQEGEDSGPFSRFGDWEQRVPACPIPGMRSGEPVGSPELPFTHHWARAVSRNSPALGV